VLQPTNERKGAARQILAATRAAFGGAVVGALFALRLLSASVSRLSTGKRATWVVAIAVAILLDAVAHEAQHAWRAATDDFDRGECID
jgi:hypothetical protein